MILATAVALAMQSSPSIACSRAERPEHPERPTDGHAHCLGRGRTSESWHHGHGASPHPPTDAGEFGPATPDRLGVELRGEVAWLPHLALKDSQRVKLLSPNLKEPRRSISPERGRVLEAVWSLVCTNRPGACSINIVQVY
jgi:hypothetical protein